MGNESYGAAQRALAELKNAIYQALLTAPPEGLRNSDIGRMLGIYSGHIGHEGHIPRTLLAIMQDEGVVAQGKDKRWRLVQYPLPPTSEED